MVSTEAVCESGMFGRLICKMSQAKLPHASKPLKLRRVYQPRHKRTDRVAGIDTNYVMNRVAIDPF